MRTSRSFPVSVSRSATLAMALAFPIAAVAAPPCPSLSHSGRWTGTGSESTALSAQVVNHLGDWLELDGPPGTASLATRARQRLRGSAAAPAEVLHAGREVETRWYRELVESAHAFKVAIEGLDLDCDLEADRWVSGEFHKALFGPAALSRQGDSDAMAQRALAKLAALVTSALTDRLGSEPMAGLRLAQGTVWLARLSAQRPEVVAAIRAPLSALAGGAVARWSRSAAAKLGTAQDREATRTQLEAAVRALSGGEPLADPTEKWIESARKLRYAGHPQDAPRGIRGTGDGTSTRATGKGAPPAGGGTGRGTDRDENDEPDADDYRVSTAPYEN